MMPLLLRSSVQGTPLMPVIASVVVQSGTCACPTTRGASLTVQQQPAAALCQQHVDPSFLAIQSGMSTCPTTRSASSTRTLAASCCASPCSEPCAHWRLHTACGTCCASSIARPPASPCVPTSSPCSAATSTTRAWPRSLYHLFTFLLISKMHNDAPRVSVRTSPSRHVLPQGWESRMA